jgi:hypothetical protein
MPGLGGPYETKANILAFLQKLKSDLTLADITDMIYNASTEMINSKTDTYWEIFSGDLYQDGTGRDHVFCPVVPIATLTGLVIIATDETEDSLDVSGSDRQVWYNSKTGIIKRVNWYEDRIERDTDYGAIFPLGVQNIKITGTFGRDATNHDTLNILKLLQTFICMKILGFQFPSKFNVVDAIEEKIGEYSYRIGDMQYTTNLKNQKFTLDGYIDMLFGLLPKDDQLEVLVI